MWSLTTAARYIVIDITRYFVYYPRPVILGKEDLKHLITTVIRARGGKIDGIIKLRMEYRRHDEAILLKD